MSLYGYTDIYFLWFAQLKLTYVFLSVSIKFSFIILCHFIPIQSENKFKNNFTSKIILIMRSDKKIKEGKQIFAQKDIKI